MFFIVGKTQIKNQKVMYGQFLTPLPPSRDSESLKIPYEKEPIGTDATSLPPHIDSPRHHHPHVPDTAVVDSFIIVAEDLPEPIAMVSDTSAPMVTVASPEGEVSMGKSRRPKDLSPTALQFLQDPPPLQLQEGPTQKSSKRRDQNRRKSSAVSVVLSSPRQQRLTSSSQHGHHRSVTPPSPLIRARELDDALAECLDKKMFRRMKHQLVAFAACTETPFDYPAHELERFHLRENLGEYYAAYERSQHERSAGVGGVVVGTRRSPQRHRRSEFSDDVYLADRVPLTKFRRLGPNGEEQTDDEDADKPRGKLPRERSPRPAGGASDRSKTNNNHQPVHMARRQRRRSPPTRGLLETDHGALTRRALRKVQVQLKKETTAGARRAPAALIPQRPATAATPKPPPVNLLETAEGLDFIPRPPLYPPEPSGGRRSVSSPPRDPDEIGTLVGDGIDGSIFDRADQDDVDGVNEGLARQPMADDEDDERVSVPPPPHAARIERFIDDMPGPDELAPVGDHRRRRASSSYLLYQKSQEQAVSKQGFSTAAALQRTTSNISWRILDFYAAQHKQSIEERKLHALERKAQRKAKKKDGLDTETRCALTLRRAQTAKKAQELERLRSEATKSQRSTLRRLQEMEEAKRSKQREATIRLALEMDKIKDAERAERAKLKDHEAALRYGIVLKKLRAGTPEPRGDTPPEPQLLPTDEEIEALRREEEHRVWLAVTAVAVLRNHSGRILNRFFHIVIEQARRRKEEERRRFAALFEVQRVCRGMTARAAMRVSHLRYDSARKIQSLWRCCAARQTTSHLANRVIWYLEAVHGTRDTLAATMIQKHVRRHLAKGHVLERARDVQLWTEIRCTEEILEDRAMFATPPPEPEVEEEEEPETPVHIREERERERVKDANVRIVQRAARAALSCTDVSLKKAGREIASLKDVVQHCCESYKTRLTHRPQWTYRVSSASVRRQQHDQLVVGLKLKQSDDGKHVM